MGAKSGYIMPGSRWENGFIECFNASLCDELFDGEIFYSVMARLIPRCEVASIVPGV